MVGCGHGPNVIGVFYEAKPLTWIVADHASDRVVKAVAPISPGVTRANVGHAKVVHHVAATDNQDLSGSKWRQFGAKVQVVRRRQLTVDRELHHRDVSFGKRVNKDGPSTVVKAPHVVVGADPCGRHDFGDLVDQSGQSFSTLTLRR